MLLFLARCIAALYFIDYISILKDMAINAIF